MASEIAALTELLQQQMEASAQREKRMAEILNQTLKTVALAPQPALASTQAGARASSCFHSRPRVSLWTAQCFFFFFFFFFFF